jgi:peptidoglycan hydrolase-like protein with peptidoglycan-binding domain
VISHLVNTDNEKVSTNFLKDMENQDILQTNAMNSLLPSLEQQVRSFTNSSLQLPDSTMNLLGNFSGSMLAEIGEYELEVNFNQAFDEILGNFPILEASTTNPQLSTVLDDSDSLIGDMSTLLAEVLWDSTVSTVKEELEAFPSDLAADMFDSTVAKEGEQLELLTSSNDSVFKDEISPSALAALELGVLRAKEQLEIFARRRDFLELLEQAFDDNVSSDQLNALIQDLANGEAIPEIKIVSANELNNYSGAFGQNTIYLAEEFLIKNLTNLEAVESVLLEEIGHFIDEELGSSDSKGDEGDIFSKIVRGETVSEDELRAIKAEDDSATILLDGEKLAVELATSSPISADAAERKAQDELADKAASYPGYALKYDPSNPNEYDEDPEVVRIWQQRMADLGYSIDVDGYYGQQSAQVARQFQEDNGLKVDGYVGPQTWAASFSLGTPTAKNQTSSSPISADAAERKAQDELADKAASYPDYALKYDPSNPNEYDEDPEVVRIWQQRMADLGYSIDVDGYYGQQSAQVARQFQEDNGLKIDGYVGPQTWAASFSIATPSKIPSKLSSETPPYPGYNLIYNPSAPEYNEDPAVVQLWQQRMKDLGYSIDVDGYYGPQSAQVARQFQEDNGLKIDGYVGPQTWAASFSSATSSKTPSKLSSQAPPYPGYNLIYNPSAPEYNEDPAVVQLWQQRMKDLGYSIDVDGYYGPQSAQVARQFQKDNALEVDGYVGPQTWAVSFSSATSSKTSPGKLASTTPFYLAAIAGKEWEFFNEGKLKEHQEGAWQRVGEYWKSVGSNLDGKDTDVPWSAAFISWVMKQGGAGDHFEYSASHSTYITDAIEDRKNNDSEAAFFGYKLDEYSPKVGDLVGYSRQNGVNFNTRGFYKSHTDIVVAVRNREIDVIGGNVSDSVTKKTLAIDSQGRLIDKSQDWFVILSNRLGSQPTQGKTSSGKLSSEAPPYPGYNLIYNPNAPEYNEDPAVVRLWQQRMKDLSYSIDVDGYYGPQSAQVARQFQKDNGLEVDGYVGPQTWATSFNLGTSTDQSETSSSPSITPDAAERQAQAEREAEREAAYRPLYNRELSKESSLLEINPVDAETTWNMTAQEMLEENKDFLQKAAERYGIDGRAIAGAIRWEYEESYKEFLGIKVYSREFDEFVYNQVQKTGSLDVDASDTVVDIPFGIGIYSLDGNGWGKMHFDTAIEVLKASGEKVSDSPDFNRSLSRMLALPTSAIDLIARYMQQAAQAYSKYGFDISDDPAVLTTLYRIGEDDMSFEERAKDTKDKGNQPKPETEGMGKWVADNLASLKDYQT